jgi:hypothetical protein
VRKFTFAFRVGPGPLGMEKDKGKDNKFEAVYEWVDAVALSRKRKQFARDFSDGCLAAEVIKHYAGDRFAVDLHNYSEALSGPRKRDNWNLLNDKVLKKHLGIKLDKARIEELCSFAEDAAEGLLLEVKAKFEAGAPPPARKQLLAPPAPPPEHATGGKRKGAQGAAPAAAPRKGNARGRGDKDDSSPAPGVARGGGSRADRAPPVRDVHELQAHGGSPPANRPAEPQPPAGRAVERRAGEASGASPAPAGRGRAVHRASSASKASERGSPKRAVLPGPGGRGSESREWWGESSQDRGSFEKHGHGRERGQGHVRYGALDNLLELAQGDLGQFDMQLQMHIKNEHRGREEVLLPPVKNAHRPGNGARERSLSPAKGQRDRSLSPTKMPKSKDPPRKQIPSHDSPQKGRVGGRDASPAKGQGLGQGGKGQARALGKGSESNKLKRERREAWAEEGDGGLAPDQGPDLVEECDEALDGLRTAHSALEKAIEKLEAMSLQFASEDRLPDVRELGVMVSAANERMVLKARKQGAAAGGAAWGGREGDGAWGARDIDLYKDLAPHYRAAEQDLPQAHVRRLPDMDLLGFNAVSGGGPGGAFGMGEYRKMHGELQNYPWFNPYLPSVA